MIAKDFYDLTTEKIPQVEGFVCSTCDNLCTIRGNGNTTDIMIIFSEDPDGFTTGDIPQADSIVFTSRDDIWTVWRKGYSSYITAMPTESFDIILSVL